MLHRWREMSHPTSVLVFLKTFWDITECKWIWKSPKHMNRTLRPGSTPAPAANSILLPPWLYFACEAEKCVDVCVFAVFYWSLRWTENNSLSYSHQSLRKNKLQSSSVSRWKPVFPSWRSSLKLLYLVQKQQKSKPYLPCYFFNASVPLLKPLPSHRR